MLRAGGPFVAPPVAAGPMPATPGAAEAPTAIDCEIAREQAAALGVAGRRLQAAVDAFHDHVAALPGDAARRERLQDEVAHRAYALLLQRECIGFVHGNGEWLCRAYGLPDDVLRRLGFTLP
jgi:hypothetical protein